jgi:endonuclease/exonuclease/phosphatase family metal-dependent hydrolase
MVSLDNQLTVASYNVHKCVGLDGRFEPDRVARVIEELNADVIGLQEIDSSHFSCKESEQVEYLAGATGYRAIMGPTITRQDSHYGNALLTNHRIVDIRHIDLSIPRREPRCAIDVELEINGALVRVIVAHLGLSLLERPHQFRHLHSLLDGNSHHIEILLGDFNEWYPRSRTLKSMHDHFGRPPAPVTFPSFFPLLALDRIWVKPKKTLMALRAHSTPLARVASDHLPIIATIEIG